jgi:hypothetical protein
MIYEGELATEPGPKKKHEMRQYFHHQLSQLWDAHPSLRVMKDNFVRFLAPERFPGYAQVPFNAFAERLKISGFRFVPLISDAFDTCCSIDIVYLRPEKYGPLIQRQTGDIDNRIKTLFDALRVPQPGPEIDELADETPGPDERPFFCLLEDDSLITEFRVTGDRLLAPKAPVANWPDRQTIGHPTNEVHLAITVEVKLVRATELNLPFS